MSETATLIKVGATAIVLAMIEDDVLGDDLTLANPVGAIRHALVIAAFYLFDHAGEAR